jgi:hypothetical protein
MLNQEASARHAADIGPALPRPHHAGGEAGEEVPLLLVAVMPQVRLMAVILVPHVAGVMTATMAALPAARGRIARGRECGGGERNHGNGGYEG